ncbi:MULTISPECIES: autotransporter assembly complex protein TamA [unclassified Aureimonas]|uniref:autotransporter assembly complex protein TamA n=1 Tax=unclassified Aureimonas TaxID=2615206 RepID=UPI0009EADFE4|nr:MULTISPECIES: autotransporter assembly complex family protein [unclassified Aureimonas]
MSEVRVIPEKSKPEGGRFRPGKSAKASACATSLLLAAALAGAVPSQAYAFEIFGWKFFEKDEETADLVDPVSYSVTLTVVGAAPDEAKTLQEELEGASTLVSDKDDPVSGSLGLLSKAKGDRKRLVASLYENARYEGLVTIRIQGQDIADLAPDAAFDTASGPVPVEITVEPGALFKLGAVDITADGTPVPPDATELAPGGTAESVRILREEGRLFERLRGEGRPFVAVTDRDVVADGATKTLDYRLAVSPGEPVPFGEIFVEGAKDVDPGFIAYMAGIEQGKVFTPADLKKARERLLKLDVFSSVTVKEAKGQAEDGTLPVQIEVGERKFRYYGVGATYSNTEGAGVNGYWGHRNLFGRAESLRIDAAVSRIGATAVSDTVRETDDFDYKLGAVFKKPGVLGPDSVYIGSIEAVSEHPLAYDRDSFAVTSGVQYELSDQQTIEARIRGEYEEITDYLGTEDFLIASVPITYTFDGRDDKLNPTEGFLAKLYAEPSYEISNGTPFVKARGDLSAYLSLSESDRFVLVGRVAYGSVFGADLQDIPNDRRFYAGGGGSVRGYAFQTIGPYYPSVPRPGGDPSFVDTPTGGLSLFEASAEVRIGVTEKIQIVPFVDAGAVSDELTPDFSNLKIGTGIGARYLTSFGPIRVDVGIPLDPGPRDGDFQIYAGIGQAF